MSLDSYQGKSAFQAPKPGLSSDDFNYFSTQNRRLREGFVLGKAQNDLQRSQVDSTTARGRINLAEQFSQVRRQLPSQYAQRGLRNSGLYDRGLRDFARSKQLGTFDLEASYADQLAGINAANQQLDVVGKTGLDDVASAMAARRATLAEQIREVQ